MVFVVFDLVDVVFPWWGLEHLETRFELVFPFVLETFNKVKVLCLVNKQDFVSRLSHKKFGQIGGLKSIFSTTFIVKHFSQFHEIYTKFYEIGECFTTSQFLGVLLKPAPPCEAWPPPFPLYSNSRCCLSHIGGGLELYSPNDPGTKDSRAKQSERPTLTNLHHVEMVKNDSNQGVLAEHAYNIELYAT